MFPKFSIPRNRIAKFPRGKGKSKLMVVNRNPFFIEHKNFKDIVSILDKTYMLVLNDTRVLKARIPLRKPSGRWVDFLFVERVGDGVIKGMLRGRVKPGWILTTVKGVKFSVIGRDKGGYVVLRSDADIFDVMRDEGKMPLPPYIEREPAPEDEEFYQTVFAKKYGSIAAPTAGLHFTDDILDGLKRKGVKIRFITLHIGPGTFKPVRDHGRHTMEKEYYDIPPDVAGDIANHKGKDGRILAVGTTVVRALETWATTKKIRGYTDLYIKPPYEFKVVDALLTNFHLPDGTPIQLVAAFMGWELLEKSYDEALKNDYMFFSYGDAMLIM